MTMIVLMFIILISIIMLSTTITAAAAAGLVVRNRTRRIPTIPTTRIVQLSTFISEKATITKTTTFQQSNNDNDNNKLLSRSTPIIITSSSIRRGMQKLYSTSSDTTGSSSSSSSTNSNNNFNNNNNSIIITSTKSNTIKKIQLLINKRKKRYEYQQTIIEGYKIIIDLLTNKYTYQLIDTILVSTDVYNEYISIITTILQNHHNQQQNVQYVPTIVQATPEVLQSCSDTITNQGIIAICTIPSLDYFQQRQQKQLQEQSYINNNFNKVSNMYLILDGVADPGNVGTLIRSAVGASIHTIFLLQNSCDPYNTKALRSAMGTTFHIPILFCTSWNECYTLLQSTSYNCLPHRIYAATMITENDTNANTNKNDDDTNNANNANSSINIPHFNINWCTDTYDSCALIIGNEGNGLQEEIRNSIIQEQLSPQSQHNNANVNVNNDATSIIPPKIIQAVHVPMASSTSISTSLGHTTGSNVNDNDTVVIESLNAAVCGSIIMFEYYQQRYMFLNQQKNNDKQQQIESINK